MEVATAAQDDDLEQEAALVGAVQGVVTVVLDSAGVSDAGVPTFLAGTPTTVV